MKIQGHDVPISDIPKKSIKHLLRYPISLYKDLRSVHYLEKNSRKSNTSGTIIRVGFLVQMAEVWDKEEPVYEALKNNKIFEVKLIVIPAYNSVKKTVETNYKDNYFLTKYPDAIRAYNNGKWIDLKDKFDYVFYQRPYDHYLPEEYRSSNLVKFTRCCYIPYGFSGSDNFNDINSGKDFFRNMYVRFAESDYIADLARGAYKSQYEKNLHHIESLGYPVLQAYFTINATKEYKRILWTPRWSYDEKVGGSHFLEYKDTLIRLKEFYPNIKITFRPHPMLFDELIVKSLMKNEDIILYLNYLKHNSIKYDTGAPVFNTFQNTDILITDYSSIIIQFFITGRPIIYCDSSNIVLNKTFQRIAEGMYIAKNEDQVLKYVSDLQNGNDYLFKKRQDIILNFLKIHKNATKNIIKWLIDDFFS